MRCRLVRGSFFRLEGSGAGGGSGSVCGSSSSSSLARCLVDRREGAGRFLLEFCSYSELSDKSSSLLGSLYDTAPRLRFVLVAMMAPDREWPVERRIWRVTGDMRAMRPRDYGRMSSYSSMSLQFRMCWKVVVHEHQSGEDESCGPTHRGDIIEALRSPAKSGTTTSTPSHISASFELQITSPTIFCYFERGKILSRV